MRKLLTILFLLFSLIASATDYYVKTGGNDEAAGTSDGTAWATTTKVNAVWAAGTFAPGDNIYFNRGNSFYGSIIVTESGTSGNPITIGAYGTGAEPIIYGFTTLTSWTDEGGGIYSKVITPESAINVVTIDDVEYAMGREPDSEYSTYETAVTNEYITDNELVDESVTDWTGAEAVIRKNDYLMNRCSITSHVNQTLYYTDLGAGTTYPLTATFGYFIQNDLKTLDTYGEWYYYNDTIYMYFGAVDPTTVTVKVATIDNLIYIAGYDYINIEDIELEGANISGIRLDGISGAGGYVTYVNINNCVIDYSGCDGIKLDSTSYSTIDSTSISYSGRAGIYGNVGSECEITYCNISYSGMIAGRANTGSYANGIRNNYLTSTTIQYNTVEYSGSDGIYFQGDDTEVRNNYINYSSMIVSDRGGIYTGGSTNTGRIIDGNIVLNTYGNNTGAYSWRRYARGIYLDAYGSGVAVTNNTIAYSGDHGICVNGGHENTIRNNLCYANVVSAFYIQDIGTNPYSNIVTVNKFICKDVGTSAFRGWASNAVTIAAFTRLDSNYYARPIDDTDVVYLFTPGAMTLAEWQSLSSLDAETQGSPKSITNTSELYFYYNASNSAIEQLISRPMTGIDGTEYNDIYVTIPAWRGIVLFEGESSFPTGTQVFATPDATKTKFMKTSDGRFMIIVQ